jgi:transcriptional regulator with XRE-family HTH domain
MKELAIKKIVEAREAKELTQEQLANKIAERLDQTYSRRQYQKIEAGEFPKYKKKIVTAIEQILEIQIIDLVYENEIDDSGLTKPYKNNQDSATDELDGIFYVSALAQAIYSQRCHDENYITDLPKVDLPGVDPHGDEWGDECRIFEVNGDSMHPYYEHGYFLLCKPVDLTVPLDIKVFDSHVIVRSKDILLGWLAVKDNENYVVQNKKKSPFAVPIAKVKELWIVKRVLHWQDPLSKKFNFNKDA